MPEGPEVRTIADKISLSLKGYFLDDICYTTKYIGNSKPRQNGIDNIENLGDLFPQELIRVYSRGKKVIFEFKSFWIVSSLGMEGHWTFKMEKHSDFWLVFVPPENKSSESDPDNVTLYFSDSRHFGFNNICMTKKSLDDALSDIGPDILGDEISPSVWRNSLRRSKKKQICAVLLDQSRISGIGNYLKSEILYAAKTKPDRQVQDLNDDEIECLRVHSHRIARESYQAQGLTISTYWDPDGNKGTYDTLVYHKKTDPFGHNIIQSTFSDKRTTWWVPEIQK